jgi:signal transduction histidine kinase
MQRATRRGSVRVVSLSARFTLALSAMALVLFGIFGTWQVRTEEQQLRRAARRDTELLGRSLQVSFENALRDRQSEDVQETLTALERIDPTVDVLVYDFGGARIAASTGAVERGTWNGPPPLHAVLAFVDDPEPGYVLLRMPLRITREERSATLVVVRPLDDVRADLAATRTSVAAAVAGFVLLVALITAFLSRLLVGQPLGAMVRVMRRVRAGDLSPPAAPRRGDEVGQTLGEFESLVEALREARVKLEAEADARRRVEAQLRELDKMRAVAQLAAGLAHEIGSPLQILEGRLAALGAKADDATETRRVTGILLEQTRRITRIVVRLKELARRRPLAHERFDAIGPVRTVVDLLEGEARRRGVELALVEGDDLPLVEGDSDAVQQVVLNLVRNAFDATPRGGHVSVALARTALQRAGRPSCDALRITVSDDGRGMEPDTREHAFEPFFTTREASGGSGLGLAVVKGIVDELDAQIALESTPGEGTRVVLDIPAPPAHVELADASE